MKDELQKFWRTNFPNCPPVSYLFKSELNKLWFRIHSLPDSKRYPENVEETREILRRQNILFNDVIGENEECFIIQGIFNANPLEKFIDQFQTLGNLLKEELKPIPRHNFEKDVEANEFFRVGIGKQKIKFNDLREVFIAVAVWNAAYFFVLNPRLKRIFAPYDGGVDIILESSAKRDELKEKYKDWLSSRSDGL